MAIRPPHPRHVNTPAAVAADQAAGLRTLLSRRCLRLLPVLGDHDMAAQGACAAQLAAGLARAGHDVILLDAAGSALRSLAAGPADDLLALIRGDSDFGSVAVRAAPGLRIIDARQGLPALIEENAANADFFGGFLRLAEPPEMLVLCLPQIAAPDGGLWLPLPGGACEAMLVTSPGEQALTAAYAAVKQACAIAGRTARGAAPAFRVLVNGADGEREARAICRQLSDTARRFLGATVGYAGNVPCNNRGRAFGTAPAGQRVAAPHAEAARAFARIASEVPGWRLPECMLNESIATQTH